MARRKNIFEKKTGLNRVLSGQPGHRSTGFCQVFSHPGFLPYPDQSNHQVDRIPGRPGPGSTCLAGSGLITIMG